MNNKTFCRECPTCKTKIYHQNKYYSDNADEAKTPCSKCRNIHAKSRKELICFTCKKTFFKRQVRKSANNKHFCSKECWYASDLYSLVNKRFGKLIVLTKYRKNNTTYYVCKCDCGKEMTTSHSNLKSGSCKSCGCLIFEIRKSERKPIEKTISHSIWNYYLRNAKDRNYIWNLSEEEFLILIKTSCYYCGAEPFNYVKRRYKTETEKGLPFNGVDRLDNTVGYVTDNCVPCCKICNAAKSNLTLDEFKAWATKLSSHLATL